MSFSIPVKFLVYKCTVAFNIPFYRAEILMTAHIQFIFIFRVRLREQRRRRRLAALHSFEQEQEACCGQAIFCCLHVRH